MLCAVLAHVLGKQHQKEGTCDGSLKKFLLSLSDRDLQKELQLAASLHDTRVKVELCNDGSQAVRGFGDVQSWQGLAYRADSPQHVIHGLIHFCLYRKCP
jgi:hypothetical protein